MAGSRRPGPDVEPPEDIDPRDLDYEVRSQLRTLSKQAADRVARHLVAAGRLVDEDPEAALVHARAARAHGARVAVVRQAVGEIAYAAGEWAEAIAELRTARRMTGDNSALPLLADAERALGRPDRALRLAQSPEALALPPAERAELRIVEAGARRDLGQLDAALITLQDSGLDRRKVEPWSARLWYAFADLLAALGRTDEAREWFGAAAGADQDGSTGADERILELDGVEILLDEDTPEPDGSPGGGSADDGGPVIGESAPTFGGSADGELVAEGSPGGGLVDGGGVDSGADGGEVAADGVPAEAGGPVDGVTGDAADGGPVGGALAEDGVPADGAEPGDGASVGDGGAADGGSVDDAVTGDGAPAEGEGPVDGGLAEDGGGAVDGASGGDGAPGDGKPGWEMRFSSERPEEEAAAGRPPAIGPAFSDGAEQRPDH